MLGAVLAASLGAAWLTPNEASACSEPVCQDGFLVPSGTASVPANAPGLFWRAVRDGATGVADEVSAWQVPRASSDGGRAAANEGPTATRAPLHVTRVALGPTDGPATDAAAHGVLLTLPLVAGEHVHVEAADTCVIGGLRPFSADLTITPAQPLPTQLGTLTASPMQRGRLTIASEGGGCSREAETVYVDVDLSLADGAAPWADLLLYETYVDGTRHHAASSTIHTPAPHESWVGRGRDRLALVCDAAGSDTPLLTPGEHRVELTARLAGSDVVLRSEPIVIALACPPDSPTTPADTLYDAVSYQTGALVIAGQLALLLYIVLTRKRRRGGGRRGEP